VGAAAMSLVDQFFEASPRVWQRLAGEARNIKSVFMWLWRRLRIDQGCRLSHYSWLSNSTAWAGSSNYDGWDIKQAGKILGLSFNHDYNEARREYGSFRLSDVAAPYAAVTR
jgi:hypothetical protein